MALLLTFAFLAGLATILAPCIWPILPVVLTVSAGGKSRTKPLGITLGVILSFSFFTLFLSSLVRVFHIDAGIFRLFSVVIIALFGFSMLIPKLSVVMESGISRLSSLFGIQNRNSNTGFVGGFITGLSLGIVWTPCAGPILASIAALSALGKVNAEVVLITLSYALGAGIPLFIISFGSQRILERFRLFSKYTGTVQKIFGVLMILVAIAIYKNWDTALSAALLNKFPNFAAGSNIFESSSGLTNQLSNLTGNSSSAPADTLGNYGPAPDFVGITNWLNTDKPLHISDLKGKVVLVDFWTYTCINCIRTLPFTTNWYDKYKDQGFVVIGVHTPEFEFEHDTGNVQNAIKQYNIHYPVAQDNNYATWNNYSNQYWPAEYLIDANGNLRETHFGEGNYAETEQNIQTLLKEAGQNINKGLVNISDQTPTGEQSPETYLGSARAQYYYPSQGFQNGDQQFNLSSNIPQNSFDLGGAFTVADDEITSGNGAVLEYNFTANKVFLVLRPPVNLPSGKIKVLLDGKPVDQSNAGADVIGGEVTVDSDRLYNLIDLKGKSGNHLLHLEFETPGLRAYAFTFG